VAIRNATLFAAIAALWPAVTTALAVHEVSANVSARAPAKLLAMFVCDRETPLSLPPPMEGK
jgi:hypothetical protein